MDKLSLLSELECLGIFLNVETLDQYNKKELLKRLSQVGKPISIKVMATICITYCIKDTRYWEFIINNTIKFGMVCISNMGLFFFNSILPVTFVWIVRSKQKFGIQKD